MSPRGGKSSPTDSGGRADVGWFDERTADSACDWIENRCTFWQGKWAGQPFVLQPWQRDEIIRPIFGWKRRDATRPRRDWPRLIRTAFVMVAKTNGKTPLGAAIGGLGLVWDCEPGAEIYSCAADRDQASIVYGDFEGFVRQSPEMSSRLRIFPGGRRIVDSSSHSFYRVLTADSATKHGLRPHMVIFDELHTQKNRRLYSTMRRAIPKREQSLMICFTTAGEYDEDALWWTEYEYAQGILDGEIHDPTHLALVYKADDADDFDDEATLRKANPNIGVSVDLDTLKSDWEQAKRKSPADQAEFKQLHGNVAGDSTQSPINMLAFGECASEAVCEGPAYCGVDVSSKGDLTAAALWFPETHSVIVQCWIPGENMLERKRLDVFDYPRHVKDGWVTATEGNYIDQRSIRTQLNEWAQTHTIAEVGYDPRFVTDLPIWLEEDGFEVIEVLQGFRLSEAITFLRTAILDRKVRHGGNPVLRWAAQNLRIRRSEEGQVKAVKKSERKRIDPLSATFMAINRAIAHREHEDDDLLVGEAVI